MISFFTQKRGFSLDTKEDSLTSTVFDNLKYLPTELFYKILKNSLFTDELPVVCGEILSIEFWPNWNPEGTSNTVKIEPDVYLRFQNFDLIIEAKRHNDNQQNFPQMKDQITAYFNEYNEDQVNLYYLQLGGLHSFGHDEIHVNEIYSKNVTILKANWSKLLDAVMKEKLLLENTQLHFCKSYVRILEDIIKGMELHQFYRKKWLCDLVETKITSSKISIEVKVKKV